MPRFQIGDAVLILPKFAHLYPSDQGVVIRVEPDPFRPIFNEYSVQFANGSAENLFEFQLLENRSNYQTLIAALVFDSQRQTSITHIRGTTSGRQVVLRTPEFDIDMTIQISKSRATIMGQVLERGTTQLLKRAEIRLMKESIPVTTTTSDNTGIFQFNAIPRGSTNILVLVPDKSIRLLGAFSI